MVEMGEMDEMEGTQLGSWAGMWHTCREEGGVGQLG